VDDVELGRLGVHTAYLPSNSTQCYSVRPAWTLRCVSPCTRETRRIRLSTFDIARCYRQTRRLLAFPATVNDLHRPLSLTLRDLVSAPQLRASLIPLADTWAVDIKKIIGESCELSVRYNCSWYYRTSSLSSSFTRHCCRRTFFKPRATRYWPMTSTACSCLKWCTECDLTKSSRVSLI